MTQHYSGRLLYDDAKAQGFVVDRTCYPWVGYKGLRFAPTEAVDVYTEIESRAMELHLKAHDILCIADCIRVKAVEATQILLRENL